MTSANPFDGRSTTVLILGILGLVVCGLCAPVAWVMGNSIRRDAEAAGFPEPGNSKAGRICGIVGTCLMVAGLVLFVVLMAIGASSTV